MSDDSLTIIKRNISLKIEKIDKKIEYITQLKDQALKELEKQKEILKEKELLGEAELVEREISKVQSKHEEVIQRQSQIHSAKAEYEQLMEELDKINAEITEIQMRHDNVIEQLVDKREFLKTRFESIERMDNMQIEIEAEIQQEKNEYEQEIARLATERQELLQRTDMTPSEMEFALTNLDNKLEDRERQHELDRGKLQEAMSDVKDELNATFSSSQKMEIKKEIDRLNRISLNATPNELSAIRKHVAQLTKEMSHIDTILELQEEASIQMLAEELQEQGLELTDSGHVLSRSGQTLTLEEAKQYLRQEKRVVDVAAQQNDKETLEKLLEERGLRLTPSGRIKLETGEYLSMEEAGKAGLLDGLETELMKVRGITMTASGRILTREGVTMTRSEAEHKGLLEGINLDELYTVGSETETISSTSGTSTPSGMSNADIHYLKTVLGTPLTFALAEITAKQPRDPIHYLAHWLYKFRYNQEMDELKKKEITELLEERERLAKIAAKEQAEMEAKDALMDLLARTEGQAELNVYERELKRIQEEALAAEREEEDLESEARDTLGVYNGPTRGQQLV